MTTERKRKFMIDIVFIAIVVAVVYFVIEYLAVWVLPFIIGLLVAIILQKPVAYLTEKTKMTRGFWSVLLVLVVLCLLFGLIALIVWGLYEESPGFVIWLKGKAPEIVGTFNQMSAWFSGVTDKLPGGVSTMLKDAPSNIVGTIVSAVADFVPVFGAKIVKVAPGLLISTVFSIVACCYITKDYRKITNFILCQLSDKKKELVIKVKQLFVTNILKMLRGYIIIMFITYLELFLGLTILQVEYAAILAAFIAVLDILPVVGTGTVLIPWGVISLLMGNIWQGLGILILYIAITVVRNIIEPRIIGQQVGLPPIVTLIAMYVGLKVFGVIGMMLLPVSIIILVKLQESGIIHMWNVPQKVSEADKPGLVATVKQTMKQKLSRKKKK
ncbi:MAG: sporulation integral membrane protein YtvI [Clostridia bacterium]|nr:sporulation integral membrane protein YtvI [Clostridia bacterium]